MKYDCYRRVAKRNILRLSNVSLKEALAFFDKERFGFVEDEKLKIYNNKEELLDAKSIGSKPAIKLDYEFTDDGQILENTDSELPGIDPDNSESSSERDN